MTLNNASPFQQTEFVPIEQTYSRKAKLMGLRLPDGSIVINYNHSTKTSTITDIARILQAERVMVEGTWTFVPDRESDNEDE